MSGDSQSQFGDRSPARRKDGRPSDSQAIDLEAIRDPRGWEEIGRDGQLAYLDDGCTGTPISPEAALRMEEAARRSALAGPPEPDPCPYGDLNCRTGVYSFCDGCRVSSDGEEWMEE